MHTLANSPPISSTTCKKSDDGVDITIIKSLLKNDLCNINAKLDLLYIGHQGSKSDKIKKDSSGKDKICEFKDLLNKINDNASDNLKSIIKNLSLDIDSGENLFVIGGSGSGKSVLRFSQGPQGFILRFDQDKLQTVADLLQLSLAYASLSLFFGKNM